MEDESRNPLELDAVVRKFAESAEALENVREQLRVLTELRETEEKANASLQDTAGQVARFATEAASILKGLEATRTTVAEVLKRGTDLLHGNDLKGIAETVEATSESITRFDGRVDDLEKRLNQLVKIVGALQTSIRQDMDGLKEDLQNVHTVVKTPIIKRLI